MQVEENYDSTMSLVSPLPSTTASTTNADAFPTSGQSISSQPSTNKDSLMDRAPTPNSDPPIKCRASAKKMSIPTNKKLAKRQWKGFSAPVDEEEEAEEERAPAPEPDDREDLPPPLVESPFEHSSLSSLSTPKDSPPPLEGSLYLPAPEHPPPGYHSPGANAPED